MLGTRGRCRQEVEDWENHECPETEIISGSAEDFERQMGRPPNRDEYYDNDMDKF